MKAKISFPSSAVILFSLSLLYLGIELVFNRQLLDISSSVRSDPVQVEHLQLFGRTVSGFGFTLLVLGIFQQFGFRIKGVKRWIIFTFISLLCLLSFAATFSQTLYEVFAGNPAAAAEAPYTDGLAWGFVPLIGLCIVTAFKGRRPLAVFVGLVAIAWPGMFYGQKLAVERFIISPTTAEDRLDAHYILLLRSGIEDCIISLGGTQFCDGSGPVDAEKRSTRAIMGALFMINTQAVFNDLNFSRGQIIDSISAQDMWFSTKEYYQAYLKKAADKRAEYEQYLNDQYYQPYKQASDRYLKAYNDAFSFAAKASEPVRLERIASDAARQVEAETDKGWQKYQKANQSYQSLFVSQVSAMAAQGEGIYARLCTGRESACQNLLGKKLNGLSADNALAAAQESATETASNRFYEETGYPPDIRDKEEFLKSSKTQREIRAEIEKKIQEQIEDYTLPPQWVYDPATFRDDFLHLLQSEARKKSATISTDARIAWHERMRAAFKVDIDPGLSREDFFNRLGGDPLPPLKDLVMSEDAFREKYIVPENRKIADAALQQIRDESPAYANDQQLEKQGKDYIRVLYIPAIALCLSVIIVVITLGRYFVALLSKQLAQESRFGFLTQLQLSFVKPVLWAGFLAMAALLPYRWPNPYISTDAYQNYYHRARERSPVVAQLLDWVVHVQPLIYKAGTYMPDIAYAAPQQLIHSN